MNTNHCREISERKGNLREESEMKSQEISVFLGYVTRKSSGSLFHGSVSVYHLFFHQKSIQEQDPFRKWWNLVVSLTVISLL